MINCLKGERHCEKIQEVVVTNTGLAPLLPIEMNREKTRTRKWNGSRGISRTALPKNGRDCTGTTGMKRLPTIVAYY